MPGSPSSPKNVFSMLYMLVVSLFFLLLSVKSVVELILYRDRRTA
jgi:hypothetical protein